MKKENTRNQEELVLEDALTQIIFNEKEEQDMVEDDNAEEIDDEDYEVEEMTRMMRRRTIPKRRWIPVVSVIVQNRREQSLFICQQA